MWKGVVLRMRKAMRMMRRRKRRRKRMRKRVRRRVLSLQVMKIVMRKMKVGKEGRINSMKRIS
jgi:hypothetical protein